MSLYIPNKKIINKITQTCTTPIFITDKATLNARVKEMKSAFNKNTKIFYAMKANYNPHVLKALKEAGIDGIDAVSIYEVKLAKKLGFTNEQIIFTGNNNSFDEIEEVYKKGVLLNIGSLNELENFGAKFKGASFALRLNPGVGDGECKGVVTAGDDSRFGISRKDFNLVNKIIDKYKLKLIGIHAHIGSGFYDTKFFEKAVKIILNEASNFKKLKFVNFGGGFGVRYLPNDKQINLKAFNDSIKKHLISFKKINKSDIDVYLEPGKFLVAESTCLLVKVVDIKKTANKIFVGTDSGFNHLIRPALYGAYHHIINISNPKGKLEKVDVVGNLCETTDVLGTNVLIADPKIGDYLLILTAGAYCSSMDSFYNMRPSASEVLVDKSTFKITRKKLSFKESFNRLGFTNFD